MFAKFARNTAVACVSLFAVTVSGTPAKAGDDDPNGIRLEQIGSDLSAAAWECRPGYSCYYDLTEGRNP